MMDARSHPLMLAGVKSGLLSRRSAGERLWSVSQKNWSLAAVEVGSAQRLWPAANMWCWNLSVWTSVSGQNRAFAAESIVFTSRRWRWLRITEVT